MSRYNEKRISNLEVQKTVTHQGGTGLTQKPEHELIGILSTGLDNTNTYYEQENERVTRLSNVIDRVAKKDPVFAAKALIYARTVFGQRSVTHVGAIELLPYLTGTELAKRFYSKRERNANKGGIVYRLDDMAEILAVYQAKNGVDAPIPNSIKKGFKDAIENSDAYSLAKYQMKSRAISLVDIVNLVHPSQTKIQGTVDIDVAEFQKAVMGTKFEKTAFEVKDGKVTIPTLMALVLGLLKQFNTVEDKNTEAGKIVAEKVKKGEISAEEAKNELNEAKTDNYKELIETKKIGYLALLRNLRNILKTNNTELLDKACELLVQKDFIRKSLVWPHQIDLALEIMLLEFSGQAMAKITKALDEAYELSIPNLKELLPEGKTAVVFDTSRSMAGGWYNKVYVNNKTVINKSPVEKAALIAATFAKGVYGDVYQFASFAKQITGWNPNDSINTLKKNFMSHTGECNHGTNFGSCFALFEQTDKKYDRVIIISDEQDGYNNVESSYKSYCDKFGTPYVYIVNVCGYASTSPIKNGQRVFRLYGYNQDLYDKITQMEINPAVVIDEINKIEI
jgi:polyhydroxyalkanoate synthesis regulator phasin